MIKYTEEMLEKREKDRKKVWDAIKKLKFVNTRKATRLSGFDNAWYVGYRMKELEREGKLKMIKKAKRSTLWEIKQ